MEKNLNFGQLLSNAVSLGLKNFFSLLGCLVLWLLTLWIPYVNVGTTIAIVTLPAAISKGKVISPFEIFSQKYYKFMGEFFLVTGLRSLIIVPATLFLIIPGIVLSIAYSLSTLLVVDKGKGASEALKLSNNLTYGNKVAIFFAQLILGVCIGVLASLLALLWNPLGYIVVIIALPFLLGLMASVYGQLASDVPEG
ncbi:MAG: YciC family protein [Bacteroidales bacterium]|nr:YciC family protein [Bacteroidales bacterium]MDD4673550.1 YciC family protein [Bacteroidales bacterium]MDY0349245.1 YciC family protein [Tenuifilaceae bacterium]